MDVGTQVVMLVASGGLIGAAVLIGLSRWQPRPVVAVPDAFARDRSVRDVINVSAIRVAGAGGLGLVLMAVTVAWALPSVGQTLVLGAVVGAGIAAMRIVRRHAG